MSVEIFGKPREPAFQQGVRYELSHRLRLKWYILRTSIEERLVYRGDFAFATLVRFLPIVTQIFLWSAVFGVSTADSDKQINGYRFGDMVAYFLLVMVSRAFSSMPGLTTGIARDVRDGTIKKFLTQPIDMLDYLFWHRVAHKLVYYAVATGPFVLVFWLCQSYFPRWLTVAEAMGFVAALGLAFLIGFLLETLLGLMAFWFLEVSSVVFIFMMLNYFLSGHMLPLDWLPAPYGQIVQYLPFKYLAFTPAAIALGRYTPQQLLEELGGGVLWVVVLWLANRWAFRAGVRRYSAFGG